MRSGFQIAFIFVGLAIIYVGISHFYSPSNVIEMYFGLDISAYNNDARLAIETKVRVLSGMWIAVGVIIFLSVRKFESHTMVLRLILLGLFLSAAGELFTAIRLEGNLQIAIIKASIQMFLCVGLEFWRMYMVSKSNASAE